MIVLAQTPGQTSASEGLRGIINLANSLLNSIIILLITATVAVIFFYGVSYIFKQARGDGKEMKSALSGMLWGVAALAVMVSIWGLVKFLQSTLGISNGAEAQAPSVLQIK
jgi:ABC-type maltose transport system permease subunit